MNSHELVIHRNFFYQRLAYRQCIVFLAILVGIFFTLFFIRSVEIDYQRPTYFMTDRAGHILPEVPLNQPYFQNAHVEQWTEQHLKKLFSMNFATYETVLNQAVSYFNPIGYNEFMGSLSKNRLISALTVHKYVTVVDVLEPFHVKRTLIYDQGAFAWLLDGKMRVTYFNDQNMNDPFVQDLNLTVVVRRESFSLYEDGISLRVIIA